MKIILATCGSRGDVQPMIAVCLALQSAGHDVLLIGPPENALWAKQMGCPYLGLGKDVSAFINTFDRPVSLYSGLSFIRFVRQELARQLEHLPEIIAGADLVIGSSLMFGLASTAEAKNIAYRYIAFTTQVMPSGFHPFLAIQTQTLPYLLNGMSWTMAALLDKCNITFLINCFRKKQGLAPVSNGWDHILGPHTIVACDREIATVPPDVKKNVTQTGYPHLDLPETPDPELEKFLQEGTTPVYAGFGSMPPIGQEKTIPLLVDAAKNLGRRIIIKHPRDPSPGYRGDDNVLFIRNYPHRKLFPRMAAVIHHGGAGTTATAAASGVPQLIVPHILDQYFHGHRIFLSGLGPAPIPFSRLTNARLSHGLDQCLNNPHIRQAAKNTGKSIDPDRSLQAVVDACCVPS